MANRGILGELEQGVLLALLRLGDGATGGAIHDDLEGRSLRPVAVTAIYVVLGRLQNKGYVRVDVEPVAPGGGRALKRFDLTSQGLDALRRSRAQLDQLWEDIDLEAGLRRG